MRAVAGAATALAAGTAVWGVSVERRRWTLRRTTFAVLPAGSDDLRVLHLSDLHMAPWQRAKQAFVRGLADLRPDLVVVTGDLLGHEIGLLGLRYALEPFAGTPGVYVWGSNDYWAPQVKNPFAYLAGASRHAGAPRRLDTDGLGVYLGGLGWTDLNNTAATIPVGDRTVAAFGVNDPHRGYDRLDRTASALEQLDRTGALATLGVAHAPYVRILDRFVDLGADAMFAGHTHGGQVCVPGYGALVTNCDIPREQVSGPSEWWHEGTAVPLHVSAGLGTSIYAPVRFACPPEATLITLTARPS